MANRTPNVKCVFCGMNRVISVAKFGTFDLEKDIFIQMRDTSGGKFKGGRGKGFPIIPAESLTIKQAIKNPEYNALLKEIYIFAKKFIEHAEKLK